MSTQAIPMQRPRCAACMGEGFILGFFGDGEIECDNCDGTGYQLILIDLDPYADSEWTGGVE